MKNVLRATVFVIALAMAATRAVIMTPLAIEELSQRAQAVVHGVVLSSSCQRDGAGRIYTRIELRVDEVWKGHISAGPLRVVHGGGQLGEQRTLISGQVDYQPGEEVVGFFVFNDRGEAVTLGLAQGKFHVWSNGSTGEKLAANPFHGRDHAPTGAALPSALPGPERLTLVELKKRVQGNTQ